ncbi:MAG: dihydroneopterin aldolase [Betaproteobacteria bacterium]|nr:dihydroneopterin aldolase [Betaproteobacteria bacterium]
MDKIFIADLKLHTRIGVYAWERQVAQTILLNLEIGLPSERPCHSDDLADALDYAAVVRRLKTLLQDHPYHLLERLAEALAQLVLEEFGAPWVKLSVAKLAPLPEVRQLGVSIERTRQLPDGTPPP